MFQFRRFPSYTYLFSIWWQVINLPDCSIRKSADHHVFAIPRSLSQLITSFFGSQCQGIRPAPFFTWPFFRVLNSSLFENYSFFSFGFSTSATCSFLPKFLCSKNFTLLCFTSSIASYSVFKVLLRGCISFLRCWWAQMGSNHRPRAYQARALAYWAMSPYQPVRAFLVEMKRFELSTSCVQGRRSPNWATPPCFLLKALSRAFKIKQHPILNELSSLVPDLRALRLTKCQTFAP